MNESLLEFYKQRIVALEEQVNFLEMILESQDNQQKTLENDR